MENTLCMMKMMDLNKCVFIIMVNCNIIAVTLMVNSMENVNSDIK